MSDSVFIKFDPEKIQDVANKLGNSSKDVSFGILGMKQQAMNLSTYWVSDSAAMYLEQANSLFDKAEEMCEMLQEFEQDLREVSGIYKTGETQAKNKSEALPTEGVFLV
jgi:WXG100 family type VII secretion target